MPLSNSTATTTCSPWMPRAPVPALREAHAEKADLFIAVTADQTANLTACTMAHALGARKTVAKVDEPEYTEQIDKAFFKEMGVDSVIYPEMLAAKDIINGLKMSWVRQRWDVHNGELVMLGIKLREGCEIQPAAKRYQRTR